MKGNLVVAGVVVVVVGAAVTPEAQGAGPEGARTVVVMAEGG